MKKRRISPIIQHCASLKTVNTFVNTSVCVCEKKNEIQKKDEKMLPDQICSTQKNDNTEMSYFYDFP